MAGKMIEAHEKSDTRDGMRTHGCFKVGAPVS